MVLNRFAIYNTWDGSDGIKTNGGVVVLRPAEDPAGIRWYG